MPSRFNTNILNRPIRLPRDESQLVLRQATGDGLACDTLQDDISHFAADFFIWNVQGCEARTCQGCHRHIVASNQRNVAPGRRPVSTIARKAPNAMASFAQMIAVGREGNASSPSVC